MDIATRRSELDDAIERLARLPSHQHHSREALAAVSDAMEYVRALTGTLPPQCQVPLDRAFHKALAGDSRSTVHALLQTLDVVDRMTAAFGLDSSVPSSEQQPPAYDKPKPVAETADALLVKLRKKVIPPQ